MRAVLTYVSLAPTSAPDLINSLATSELFFSAAKYNGVHPFYKQINRIHSLGNIKLEHGRYRHISTIKADTTAVFLVVHGIQILHNRLWY